MLYLLRLALFAALILPCGYVKAQYVTDGPVIGGVGPDSARIYVRTSVARPFVLRLQNGSAIFNFNDSTRADLDSSVIVNVRGLAPSTTYDITFLFAGNADSITGQLTTFPPVGSRTPVTLVAGSCQETANMKTFLEIPRHNPTHFAHLGDYTYPSYQLPDDKYPEDPAYLKLSYRRRYREVNMREMLRKISFSYVYDDDDAVDGGTTRLTFPTYRAIPGTPNYTHELIDSFYPQQQRIDVIRGFTNYFPSYPLVDTSEGIFHKFTMGNVECFHIDARGCMTSQNWGFEEVPGAPGTFRWNPKTGHTLLRQIQFDWLKTGLLTSTADWKVIFTGVVFNRSLRRYLDLGIANQGVFSPGLGTGFRIATAVAGTWVGYPEQQQLLDYIRIQGIKNVIVVSGDFHANVLDDGTNSGLPEVMGSGLSVVPGDLQVFLGFDFVGQAYGLPPAIDSLWNGGGNGLGANSSNQKNGFAKINFYGNDSARLSSVDEDGTVMGSFVLLHSSKVTARPAEAGTKPLLSVYPNPATTAVNVRLAEGYQPHSQDRARLSDETGRFITEWPLSQSNQHLTLPQLTNGLYQLSIYTRYGVWVEKLMLQR
jgi:hypothetical protein